MSHTDLVQFILAAQGSKEVIEAEEGDLRILPSSLSVSRHNAACSSAARSEHVHACRIGAVGDTRPKSMPGVGFMLGVASAERR